jgi:hypothetical protein
MACFAYSRVLACVCPLACCETAFGDHITCSTQAKACFGKELKTQIHILKREATCRAEFDRDLALNWFYRKPSTATP